MEIKTWIATMKITVFDPINIGLSHASFNYTTIRSLLNAKHIESVDIILSKSQLKQNLFLKIQDDAKVKSIIRINRSKKALSNSSEKDGKIRYLREFILSYIELIKNIKKNKPEAIYILALDNLYSLLFLFFLKRFCKVKIFIFLHNNIENCKHSRLKLVVWAKLLKKNIHGIVLSEFVYRRARELFKKNINLNLLPHPNYSHIVGKIKKEFDKIEIDFLVLGRHSNFFCEDNFGSKVLEQINKVKPNKTYTLLIKKGCLNTSLPKNIIVHEYDFPISYFQYWEFLKKSKFLIIPPKSQTRITASGVHLDSITAGIPVIAPEQGAFAENVSEQGACLLYNETNIQDVFAHALQMSINEYKTINKEIEEMSDYLSLRMNVKRLEQLLKTTSIKS